MNHHTPRQLAALLLLLVALAAACRTTPQPKAPRLVAADAQAAVDAFFQGYLEEMPGFARYLGLHTFDGRVPEVGQAAVDRSVALAQQLLKGLAGVDVKRLPEPLRLDAEISQLRAQSMVFRALELRDHQHILEYGDLFDVSAYLQRDYAPLPQRVDALIRHLEAASAQVDNVLGILAAEQPRTHLITARIVFGGTREYLQGDVVTAVTPAVRLDAALQARFDAAHARALKDVERLLTWIEQALPKANEDFRLGEPRLLRMLEVQEGVTLDLPALQRMAQEDFDRNHQAFVETAAHIFPGVTPQEAVKRVAAERIDAAKVVSTAAAQLVTLRAFITSRDLITLPGDDEATVMVTPPFMRYNSAFLDQAGPFEEKSRVAFYYITPPDPSWSKEKQDGYLPYAADLMATSIHEVYPGHFVHGLHQRRARTRVQQAFASYAFTEGWAHYAEQMMLDEGFGDGDARMRLGQLSNALLRNCRFLATLGLHAGDMSVDGAQRLFQEQCFVDEGNAQQQAYRGTYDPGYLSYTLGKLQILALRQRHQEKHGAGLKAFHDWLLGFGGAPLALLERRL